MSTSDSAILPGLDQFRVLVVDNEESIRNEIKRQLTATSIVPLEAASAREACVLLERYYVDAAIVDLKLGDADGGREVLRAMSRFAPAATAVIATKYTDRLGDFIGITAPRLAEIVHKGPEMPKDWASRPLLEACREWEASRVAIENLELPLKLLQEPERADRIVGLRDEAELACELDRLCRQLFGAVTVEREAGVSDVSIELRPIEREGLSVAITVEAEVRLGNDHASRELRGSRVVMKIGPAADIAEEAERYHTFVKYGVPLTHRVELLGHAEDQALGAVCYSFAGNVFGTSLESLDEQLRAPERQELVKRVMYSLFSDSAKSWYQVTHEPTAPIRYVDDTYRTKFAACHTAVEETLTTLHRRLGGDVVTELPREGADGLLAVGQARLRLPRYSIWGDGLFLEAVESCLVHGDMHGGNVMVELDNGDLRRVCLIDYRNVGPGPRATDFAALDASVRLADLQGILAAYGVEHESELDDDDLRTAVMACAGRVRDERKVLTAGWGPEVPRSLSTDSWATTSVQLAALARKNFEKPALTLEEYLAMALPQAYRHVGFKIGVLGRVRFAAWLSALYERSAPGVAAE